MRILKGDGSAGKNSKTSAHLFLLLDVKLMKALNRAFPLRELVGKKEN